MLFIAKLIIDHKPKPKIKQPLISKPTLLASEGARLARKILTPVTV